MKKFLADHWPGFVGALLIAGCLWLYATTAHATGRTFTVRWTAPTVYADGMPINFATFKGALIRWRRPNTTEIVGSQSVDYPSSSYVGENRLTCGKYNFTVIFQNKDLINDSEESNTVLYDTGLPCAPKAPTNVTVE